MVGGLIGLISACIGIGATLRVHKSETDERQRVLEREVCVNWLTELGSLFRETQQLHWSVVNGDFSRGEAFRRVHALSPSAAQATLDSLRMTCGEDVSARAADLWHHRRKGKVLLGDSTAMSSWETDYWLLRRQFINAVRRSQGRNELNWDEAGAARGAANKS